MEVIIIWIICGCISYLYFIKTFKHYFKDDYDSSEEISMFVVMLFLGPIGIVVLILDKIFSYLISLF